MGWFDEQILQRRASDQSLMEESLSHISAAVLGKPQPGQQNSGPGTARAAIEEIQNYYHMRPAVPPEDLEDLEEQLEYCLRPHGLMWRSVKLDKGWYKRAMGPMLAFLENPADDGEDENSSRSVVALLPNRLSGYRYRDPASGQTVRVSPSNEALLEEDAVCFYYPLPPKKLGILDLILYLKNCLNSSDYALLFLLSLAVTLTGMLMTGITRTLTGFVLESGSISLLAGTAVFMVSALISARLIEAARQLMMSRMELKTSAAMDAAVMMRVLSLPPDFFRGHSSGELSARCNAISGLCSLILGNVFSMGVSAVLSLLYITQIFHYAPGLALPALLILLVSIVISTATGLMQVWVSRRIMNCSAKENGVSFSLVSGIQKIRLAGAEKRAFAKWGHAYAETAALVYNPPMLIRMNTAINTAVSLAGTVLLFYLAVRTAVTPSEYIAFNTAFGAVTSAFAALTGAGLAAAGIRPILEMAEPILSAEPETSENRAMVTKLSGGVELSNVHFRYGQNLPWVIRGLDLKIEPGEYIGIAGSTGCGKSTLVRLLLGFEKPETGAVYYDGRDISGLDLYSLRRRIGTVTQDGLLFQGDIFSNIAVSAPQITLNDAWEAAELAGIADDIRNMPMGMQTQISEGQGGVSGGQKQRLMIARALAPKPRILIFDEATSALDNQTQKQISDALDQLQCTRIVIAHRLSTLRNCNRILVLDEGRIAEDGTYDELIAKNGIFKELTARQMTDI